MIAQLSAAGAGVKLAAVLAVALALIGAGAAGGCRWQKGEVIEAQSAQRDAERDRDDWKLRAEGLTDAVSAQNAENQRRIKASNEAKAKAAEAERRANAAAERFMKRLAEIDREHADDLADPGCAEQMRRPLCGTPLR